jgi:hypothetical protein
MLVGRNVATAETAASKMRTQCRRILLYDLTAGDGIQYEGETCWEKGCSPGIVVRHALYKKCRVPVIAVLAERAIETYGKLLANLEEHLPVLGCIQEEPGRWSAHDGRVQIHAINGDSRTASFTYVGRGDFVFINNDPNNVHDWALNGAALRPAVDRGACVLSLSTMGCNPNGLKRLQYKGGREGWYGHVQSILDTLGPTQDVLVLSIDHDDAQWGYLDLTPKAWWERDIKLAEKAFGAQGLNVSSAWLRKEPDGFWTLINRLFLTARERGEK